MTVNEVDVVSISGVKAKYHAPVPTNDHRPEALAVASHGVKAESRRLHVGWLCGGVEPLKHTFDLIHDVGAYSAAVATFEKTP
jgi:hypothetical protein